MSLEATRELFWQNVVREMLTSLSVLHAKLEAQPPQDPAEENIFDGRVAVVTTLGARIPIGSVTPLFACGIAETAAERALSQDVECTVFQIETPEGEVFTLPLQEIRSIHALSHELIEQIKAATGGGDPAEMPFGFAAFTSLARSRQAPVWSPVFTGPDFPIEPEAG